MAGPAPDIRNSTRDERLAYVQSRFVCIANCDLCGICASFHGRRAEEVLADYIEGRRSYIDCLREARR